MLAFEAAFDQLVPKAHRNRASSIQEVGSGVCQLLAPATAGILLARDTGVSSILWLDVSTFSFGFEVLVYCVRYLVGVIPLLFVTFPPVVRSHTGESIEHLSTYQELAFGFRYLMQHQALLIVTIVLSFNNFVCGCAVF